MILVYGVNVTSGVEEELFQRLVCCLLLSQHSCVLSVNSLGSRDLDGDASARSVRTWVGRYDKWGG